jgi:hypothetical protein
VYELQIVENILNITGTFQPVRSSLKVVRSSRWDVPADSAFFGRVCIFSVFDFFLSYQKQSWGPGPRFLNILNARDVLKKSLSDKDYP